MYVTAWEGSMHNFGYDLYHGPNTFCAKCHSPQNWDPESTVGINGTCFSCKFPTDAEVRVADGNDLIPEEEWVGIPCETCHRVDENGIASEEIAWLQPISGEYIEVKTTTELCERCHVQTTNNSIGSAVTHKIYYGSAHINYAGFIGETPPPQYCTDCHDPHSLAAKQCVDCHEIDEATHAKGNYAVMKAVVPCIACHDATSSFDLPPANYTAYDYGPFGEDGVWTLVDATLSKGLPKNTPLFSHAIQAKVSCNRCHKTGNPYGLTVLTAAGAVPPTPTATPTP